MGPMTDTPAPTTHEPYGVPETIAHWRRQAELCGNDVESAAFIHCADEIEKVLARVEARSTPAATLDVERAFVKGWFAALLYAIDEGGDPTSSGEARRQAAEYSRLPPHNEEPDHD